MSLFFCCLEKRHRRLKTELVLLCHTWYPSITLFLCLPVKYNKRCMVCGGKMVCVYICTITYIKAPQNTCFTRKNLWVIYVNTTRGSAEWRRTIEQWRCVCISMWCHIFQCVCVCCPVFHLIFLIWVTLYGGNKEKYMILFSLHKDPAISSNKITHCSSR